MYHFSYYKEHDKKVLWQFMEDHPFAFVTGSDADGNQVATQVPILIEENGGEWYLRGHIMRNTDHYKAFKKNSKVLAVFTGPHSYVSASWYTNPHMGSTWNYMSVHIKGNMKFLTKEELITFMKKLTLKYEDYNTNSPTFYDNLPNDFINKMLPAIDAFEIKVEELENVFKLSQNRDEESYTNIIKQLNKRGGKSKELAKEMQKRISQLFVKKRNN